jgi:hypothetical protein
MALPPLDQSLLHERRIDAMFCEKRLCGSYDPNLTIGLIVTPFSLSSAAWLI